MHPIAKLWFLRIASVPVVLFMPLAATGLTGVIAQEFGCDDWLLYSLMFVTLVLATCIAIALSVVTVFASSKAPLAERYKTLRVMVLVDALVLVSAWLISMPGRPYDRATLKFDVLRAPTIDVTGTWTGEWIDPRMDFGETITLILEQDGSAVTGTILGGGTKWRIIEGVVSGDRLNLFYVSEFAFRSGGATLLGNLKDGQLSGHYYVHERRRAGWASKGSWHAARRQ